LQLLSVALIPLYAYYIVGSRLETAQKNSDRKRRIKKVEKGTCSSSPFVTAVAVSKIIFSLDRLISGCTDRTENTDGR